MTYPDPPIILDVDPSGYITGLGQAEKATTQFTGTLGAAAIALGPVAKGLNSLTPSKQLMAGTLAFTAVAGKQEAQLSTLRATTRTLTKDNKEFGESYTGLVKQTQRLAKEYPIGNAGARELMTTMSKMGIVAKGNEQSFGSLAKTFVKLSGATGENAGGLAQGMIQLSRATGTGLQPKRMENLADSLTTVAAKSGASATGILQFSKAIAPMAQSAGIGQTKIMGISAAFSKMGEDGYGAANAFNKMLGDLSRSVREGSPEMSKYAMIVGKSADEFERMFKADPTEAITQVMEAIGSAGEAGPRMLEMLGLEGVRTQRYIQQVSQSGGLRTAVEDATQGYGTGATKDAAEAAFGGLGDSTTRLATAAEQAAEALGTPFLGAVTTLTDMLGATVSGLGAVVETSGVQKTLQAISWAALPLLAAFKLIPSIVTALGLSQLATSGPLKGLLGGYARGGGIGAGLAGRLGGDAYNRVVDSGRQPGSDRMAPINQRFAGYGERLAQSLQPSANQGTGLSPMRAIWGAGGIGLGMYLRTLSEGARLSRSSFDRRSDSTLRPLSGAVDRYMRNRDDLRWQRDNNLIGQQQYKDAMKTMRQETLGAVRPIRMLARGMLELTAQSIMSAPVVAARGLAAVAGMIPKTIAMLGGGLGAAMTAGFIGMTAKSKADEDTKKNAEATRNATSAIDDYRVAVGKAMEATSTFAGAQAAASQSNRVAPQSTSSALRVTDEDKAAAARPGAAKGRVRDYSSGGDPDVGAAERMLQTQFGATGVGAEEIQQIQMDLFNSGFNRQQVAEISRSIPTRANPDASQTASIVGQVEDIGGMSRRGGFRGAMGRAQQGIETGVAWLQGRDPGYEGTAGSIDTLGDDARERGKNLIADTYATRDERSDVYTPEYARKMQFEDVDAAIQKAFDIGDTDLAESLMLEFQNAKGSGVSKKNQGTKFSRAEIEDGGGYTATLAERDKAFRVGTYEATQTAAANRPQLNEGWVTRNLSGNPLAEIFSETGEGRANRAVTRLMGDPENPRFQQQALQTTLMEQRQAGTAMLDLYRHAGDAANRLGDLGDATISFLAALRQAAQFQISARSGYQSSSETRQAKAAMYAVDARRTARTPDQKRQQDEGVIGLLEVRDEMLGEANAMATNIREQQVQRTRMIADYGTQVTHIRADFNTQIERQEEQHQITLTRMERNHLLQLTHAREDYQRGVRIATRDFNKQMARAAEDGARAAYDPYTRIQVQPIWDTANLNINMDEQNDALQRQLADLETLRAAGASNDLISMLGLNDPKNAQQLAQIVADMGQDPSVLAALEETVAQRMQLGGELTRDAANVGMTRAAEDFRQSMDDQAEAFATSLSRAQQAYDTGLSDMNADHARALDIAAADQERMMNRMATAQQLALTRMTEDIKRQDEKIVTDLAGYHEIMTQAIDGQVVDFRGKTKSSLEGVKSDIELFRDDLEQIIIDMGPGIGVYLDVRYSQAPMGDRGSNPRGYDNSGGPSSGDESAAGYVVGSGYQPPTSGPVTSGFGPRVSPGGIGSTNHKGIDYGVPVGTPVRAAWAGTVKSAGTLGTYGNLVVVDHGDGRETRYAHLSRFRATPGERVDRGEVIALSGNTGASTGPHLHFETRQNGQAINPNRAVQTWAFAQGGIATQPTNALIAEAGSNEAVIPLNDQGVSALAKALRQFVRPEDAKALKASGGTVIQTYDHSTHHSDHSTRFEGAITVQAQDPNEMARKLAAKKRTAALTAPATRR